MPTVDLGSAVVAAWLVMLGAGALNFALFALSRHRTRIRTVEVRVGDDVLVGLGVLFLVPAAIVAGFGHYILEANTGSYGRPSDFRNSATLAGICWFFIRVVAPASILLGLGILARAVFRHWQTNRRRQDAQPLASKSRGSTSDFGRGKAGRHPK